MRLAWRRQRGASSGMAFRWISFPSRRSTCSFEKFMTSTTVQKLLMENSAGTRGAEVGGRARIRGSLAPGLELGWVPRRALGLESYRLRPLGGAKKGLQLCLPLQPPTHPQPGQHFADPGMPLSVLPTRT